MRLLIWHWGRRGAGPLFAANLARALGTVPGVQVSLSLAAGAELLAAEGAPPCVWREPTYSTTAGYILRRLGGMFLNRRTLSEVRGVQPDLALCAMPALLDGRMRAALMALNVPYGVVVHDAVAHPGEGLRFRAMDQHRLLSGAAFLVCLSVHVATALQAQGFGREDQKLITLWHPPIRLGGAAAPAQPRRSGPLRLLNFGRLLPYKGLDLLAEALTRLGPVPAFELRVCGEGPESAALTRLRTLPHVRVEARWFNDAELPGLLTWADAVVLPYREASQSGVAALALAAGRPVLATNVGGLPEQLGQAPSALLCAPTPEGISDGLSALLTRLTAHQTPAPELCAETEWNNFAKKLISALT